jgi:signal transduction histidine kinase
MSFKKIFKIKIEPNNIYPFFFTIIFVVILIQYPFHTLEALFYDFMAKYDFNVSAPKEIVFVGVDEESDQMLGEVFPYTYTTQNKFLKKLTEDDPAFINYLMIPREPQDQDDQINIKEFKNIVENYSQNNGYFRFGTTMYRWGEELPPEYLVDLGYSLSQIYVDNSTSAKDDVARRAILNVSGVDSLHLWTANNYLRSKNIQFLDATQIFGSYYNSEADSNFVLFRYGHNPLENNINFKLIPFYRVTSGNFPTGFFKDKIVIVGPKYISNSDDYVKTPFGKDEIKSPKLFIHGLIINSLINKKTIYQFSETFLDIFSILLAIVLSFIISRIQPAKGLLVIMALILSFFIISFGLFSLMGIWLKLSHIILSIFVVYYIWIPFKAIGEYQTRYAIQEETKLLKKVDKLKQNFISLMSHDLKTPVAKIAGIADILRVKYPNGPDQLALIDNIINSTKELNNFISSILDLTKIESQNITINKTQKDVNQIITQLTDKLKFEASQNDIKLETDLAPLYPVSVDLVLINRVISNLIENGIKYAGKGSTIRVKTWDEKDWVYVEISDNGIGIKKEDLAHIFDKFYRVKNDASHSIKGSGLGLYLVKYFVELHHGEITVNSEFGSGTTFLIKLKNE